MAVCAEQCEGLIFVFVKEIDLTDKGNHVEVTDVKTVHKSSCSDN